MGDSSTNRPPNGTLNQFFSAASSSPDAMVILNRGTEFEQDISGDVISFNTNNSIDSLTGSFTATLDNKNDHLVNRFNFSKIKKMSSIEIFIRPLEVVTGTKDANSGSQTVTVPQGDGTATGKSTLNSIIADTYGKNLETGQKGKILTQIRDLNQSITVPNPAYKINKQAMLSQGYQLTKTTSPDTVTLAFYKTNNGVKVPGFSLSLPQPKNDIYSEDDFQLSFYSQGINIPGESQFFINSIIAEKSVQLPGQTDAPLTDLVGVALKMPMPTSLHQRVFFGVVLNINNSVSPAAGLTVNLNGKGIGYWLESSVVNLNPGGYEQTFTGLQLSLFANRFAERKALDIFRELLSVSTGDLPTTANLSLSTLAQNAEYLQFISSDEDYSNLYGGSLKVEDENGEPGDAKVKFRSQSNPQRLNEIDEKRERIYSGFAVSKNDTTPSIQTALGDKDWAQASANYVKNKKQLVSAQEALTNNLNAKNAAFARGISTADLDEQFKATIDSAQRKVNVLVDKQTKLIDQIVKIPKAKEQIDALQVTQQNLQTSVYRSLSTSGRTNYLKQFGIIQHWKKIFSQIVLEVMDNDSFLNNIYPFNYMFKEPSASLDGDYVSKASLGQMISDYLNYEFYFDANGHFVLKPPLYHLEIPKDNPLYIINDDDVVSFSCNDTVDGIITRIGVAGDYRESPGVEKTMIYNIFQDMRLIRDYGFHAKEINNLYFINNNSDARDFGQAYMARNNMNLFNANVTINGRPELRIGTVVYLKPRDTVYYIREISHEFTVGGTYQTTLTLIGGRRLLTGFPTTTKIQKFKRENHEYTTPLGTKSIQTVNVEVTNENATITHYILSDGFNAESIAENEIALGIPNDQQQTAANSAAASGNGPVKQKQVILLRNAYQITNHYNQALIGLIVMPDKDKNNSAIAEINKANYDFFLNLSVSSVPPVPNILDLSPTAKSDSVAIIQAGFNAFSDANLISPDNAQDTFTILQKDQFIRSFLKLMQDIATAGNLNSNDPTLQGESAFLGEFLKQVGPTGLFSSVDNLSAAEKTRILNASVIFNRIINDLDQNGSYKQLTDDVGRELPAYQNFGLSLYMANTSFAVNGSVSNADQIQRLNEAKSNAATKDDSIKLASRTLSGIHNPNSDAFKALLKKNFSSKYNFDNNTNNEGKQAGQ